MCKLPRGAVASFLLNGTPAGNCTFTDASFCDNIVEVSRGPSVHRLSLVFSAYGYSGAAPVACSDSGDVGGGGTDGGGGGGGGASTHFIVQSVAADASSCAASDNLRGNSGPGAMWALDGSAWSAFVGDRYILSLRIYL